MWQFDYFLTINRTQYVSIPGCTSLGYSSFSGVQQGSTFGLLLFVLFINDIAQTTTYSKYFMFADIKIFQTVRY